MNLLQIKHQLKNGQKQFTDKTVRLLLAEIERLQKLLEQAREESDELFPMPDTEQA
jgi:hypothetical protein